MADPVTATPPAAPPGDPARLRLGMRYAAVDLYVPLPGPMTLRHSDGEACASVSFGPPGAGAFAPVRVWSAGPSALDAVALVYEKAAAVFERVELGIDAFVAAVEGRICRQVHAWALEAWRDGLRHPLLSQLGVPDHMMAMPPRQP